MCEPSAIIPSSLRQLAQTIYQYSDNVVPHRYLLGMGGIPSVGKNVGSPTVESPSCKQPQRHQQSASRSTTERCMTP